MKYSNCSAILFALLLAIVAVNGEINQTPNEENDVGNAVDGGAVVVEAPIRRIQQLKPGEREYLSPNLLGVQNIAMTFLGPRYNFVNIFDAYREIINGVRYELLLNAKAPDGGDVVICRLIVHEKPWLRNIWGDKYRELIYSNCTDDADSSASRAAGADDYFVRAGGDRRKELNSHELADVEAQIHTEPAPVITTTATATTAAPAPENAGEQTTGLNENQQRWLDDFLSANAFNFEQAQQAVVEQEVQEAPFVQGRRARRVRRNNDKRIVGGHKTITVEEGNETLSKSLAKLAQGEEGPHYTVSKVHSATRQVVAGILTVVDADLLTQDNKIERCQVSILSRSWLPDADEVTFKCGVKRRSIRSTDNLEKKPQKKRLRDLSKSERKFEKFLKQHNRVYSSDREYQIRYRIFNENLEIIRQLNKYEQGSAKYGITEFADMTSSEYKLRAGLLQRGEGRPLLSKRVAEVPDVADLPKEFDWREKKAVTSVKNQGSCGSCWAFSVTGNIEGLYAVQRGELKEFSEQELLDCDTVDSACNGGLPDDAFTAIKKIGGLEFESEYPYKAKKGECRFNRTQARVQVKDFVDLPPRNETAMQHWLVANGPISIGINANAMQFYRGGVSHPWHGLCSRTSIDHGVLIVGYGISEYPNFHKSLPYWIVKNSWGPKWGEKGYYRVYRGDNTCGIGEMVSSAVLA